MKTHKDNELHSDVLNHHHHDSSVNSRCIGKNNENDSKSCKSQCEESCTCKCNECNCKSECPENCCG